VSHASERTAFPHTAAAATHCMRKPRCSARACRYYAYGQTGTLERFASLPEAKNTQVRFLDGVGTKKQAQSTVRPPRPHIPLPVCGSSLSSITRDCRTAVASPPLRLVITSRVADIMLTPSTTHVAGIGARRTGHQKVTRATAGRVVNMLRNNGALVGFTECFDKSARGILTDLGCVLVHAAGLLRARRLAAVERRILAPELCCRCLLRASGLALALLSQVERQHCSGGPT
jgi:hypothetical protein